MRHSILTMTLMFGLGAACALVLRLPWSGVEAPQDPETRPPAVAATAAQVRGLEQQLEALEPRLQGLDRGLKTADTAAANQGEQLGALSQRLATGLTRLDPLAPRLESLEAQMTRLAPLVPRLESLETQVAHVDPLAPRLDSLANQLARTETRVQRHETRIEECSVKLFETLMTLDTAAKAEPRIPPGAGPTPQPPAGDAPRGGPAGSAGPAPAPAPAPAGSLVLILGLLMPLGAMLFAAGSAQPPGVSSPVGAPAGHSPHADLDGRHLRAWLAGGLGYAVLGFGLMFGTTLGGWLGAPLQFLPDLWQAGAGQAVTGHLTRLAQQLPLAGAAGLIVCSALPGRLSPLGQWLTALLVGALVYPLFGHWADAHPLRADNQGWLTAIGFVDPAGAAGIAALAGVTGLVLAARLGRAGPADDPGPGGTGGGALLLRVAWLGLALTGRAEVDALPPLVLASAAGAAGAALAVLITGTLRATVGGWGQRLPAALLAGAVAAAAAAAYGTASVLGLMLLGLATGAVHGGVLKAVACRLGAGAQLAGSFAAAGVCGTLAPAILGPTGVLWPQLVGLAAVLGLAWAAARLLAQLPRLSARLGPAADRPR